MYCFEIPKPQDAISRILKLDSLKCRLMVVELSRKTKEKNVSIVSRTSAGLHLPVTSPTSSWMRAILVFCRKKLKSLCRGVLNLQTAFSIFAFFYECLLVIKGDCSVKRRGKS